MTSQIRSAIDFYDRHPISAQTILAKLGAARGTLEGLQPDDLFPHDQDHYGGLAANDALAKCAGIGVGTKVVDLCAGLGGPARYLAHRYGAIVIGIELTPARVAGAAELTQRVGLSGQVRVVEGNVMDLPLPDTSQDAVISQESLLHVSDLGRTFREAHRVLCPGGRLAFTNWTIRQPLSEPQRQLLWDGMAAATVPDPVFLFRLPSESRQRTNPRVMAGGKRRALDYVGLGDAEGACDGSRWARGSLSSRSASGLSAPPAQRACAQRLYALTHQTRLACICLLWCASTGVDSARSEHQSFVHELARFRDVFFRRWSRLGHSAP